MKLTRISVSGIGQMLKCGQQFYLRQTLGPIPPGFAQIRGRGTHSGIRADLRSKMETGFLLSLEDAKAAAADAVKLECATSQVVIDPDYEELTFDQARGKVTDEAVSLVEAYHEKVAPGIDPTALEAKIEAKPSVLSATLVGVIDLVDDEAIRDTKTTKRKPPDGLAAESDQLTMYDLLYRIHYKKPPTALTLDNLILSTHGVRVMTIDEPAREPAQIRQLLSTTNRVLNAAALDVFLPAPEGSWYCSKKWCGYWDVCEFARGRKRPTT